MTITYDLSHLSSFNPITITTEHIESDDKLLSSATDAFNSFFKEFLSLEKKDETKYLLPKSKTQLPREKPLPIEKPKTRFEQFRLEKGLTKKRKDKIVYDKNNDEYRLRYGYKRANDKSDVWMMEVPDNSTEDPYMKLEKEKKERIKEQKKRERRNQKRAARYYDEVRSSLSLKSSSKRKDDITKGLEILNNPGSTPSMNQFNKSKNKVAIFEGDSKVPKIFDRNKGQIKKNKGRKK